MLTSLRFGSGFALLLGALLALTHPARAGDVTVTLDAASGFVIKNNAATVERLRVDEATGNLSRNGALFVHTTGAGTFVGVSAGSLSNTGGGNAAFGRSVLSVNTTGDSNVAVGDSTLSANTTGNSNSALGVSALRFNVSGQNNSAFGRNALFANTTASSNSAFGINALLSNTIGTGNNAFGSSSLSSNTTGNYNSAFGLGALSGNTTGGTNSAFGVSALVGNTSGSENSAFGVSALLYNTTGGSNSAFGENALRKNISSIQNSAFGMNALFYTTSGYNSAFGMNALQQNTTGSGNSAFGRNTLFNSKGSNNSALGIGALSALTSGARNVAIGQNAGDSLTSGNDNIYINHTGAANESGFIRIGNANQTQTFIAGIHGNAINGASDLAVGVDASGELGTVTSSLRFKEAVEDMGEASDTLMRLRPVTFRYREETERGQARQYGLIAEEVAEVAPELVVNDAEGLPFAVRYQVLPSLLLNEMQKQQHVIDQQREQIAELAKRLEALESRVGTDSEGANR